MLRAILCLSTTSLRSIFFFAFSLARLNWVYDVTICLVRLIQMFAIADHNIKMFSKIATFLQNQKILQKLQKHLVITQEKDDGVKIVIFYRLQQNISVELHMT